MPLPSLAAAAPGCRKRKAGAPENERLSKRMGRLNLGAYPLLSADNYSPTKLILTRV